MGRIRKVDALLVKFGRHNEFKPRYPLGYTGSSPVEGTICVYGLKVMMSGFQPDGLGSIPSGRSICEYDGTGIRTTLRK